MKTLLLSSEDIQNFNKLIYDQKSAQLGTVVDNHIVGVGGGGGGSGQTTSCNLMALQYYLKHPGTVQTNLQRHQPMQAAGVAVGVTAAAAATAATTTTTTDGSTVTQGHQHILQSQNHLKQLQLKQPTIHHYQQHTTYHHPYYQQTALAPAHTHTHSHSHTHTPAHTHTHNTQHTLPVHALNQNSNFSAASSSTGGGTASSHAPTQQSNTTGSSLSPPGASASARTTPAIANSTSALAVRTSIVSGTKKLKTEPVLSQFHQSERLTFANSHIVWSEEHWKRVVFQDERKFNLDGPDGFSYYFHDLRNYERTLSQRPRGNSVYIYVLVTAGGPIHLEVSTSKQKPETCIETILRERSNISAKIGGSTDFLLQDHNWTANALPTVQEWLSAEGIKTQKWPTVAHDLNIMENVWGWLIREVYDSGRKFSRKDDLIFRIREAWARLPMDLLTNLFSTLPERITELYYTRGIYTNC